MFDLVNHTPHSRMIFALNCLLEFAKPQRLNGCSLVFCIANSALHPFYTQFCHCSLLSSPPIYRGEFLISGRLRRPAPFSPTTAVTPAPAAVAVASPRSPAACCTSAFASFYFTGCTFSSHPFSSTGRLSSYTLGPLLADNVSNCFAA